VEEERRQVNGMSTSGLWSISIAVIVILTISTATMGWVITRRQTGIKTSTPTYHLELLDSLYNHSPMAFAVIDPEGRFLDINSDPLELFGYSKREVSNQLFTMMVEKNSLDLTT
jgi:PAS domain-containing protein